jgi:predicted nucleic acid-binding protein
MKSILCDINIFIDIFLERKKYYDSSAKIFSLVEENKLSGFICSISYGTIYYLLSKEVNKLVAIKTLEKIKLVFKTASVDDKVIDLSIVSDFTDFEDAIQYYSAVNNKVNFIITRNKKDFKKSEIPVYTPEEFIKFIEKN